MPFYEITLIPRPLAKADLVKTIHRAVSILLDREAVVMKLENLGYKDLPYTRMTKPPIEKMYTNNYFLVGSYMPVTVKEAAEKLYKNDRNLVAAHFVDYSDLTKLPEPVAECTLEEDLVEPARRKSIEKLRAGQKMAHFSKLLVYKRAERAWRKVPKSYTIAPQRW